MKKKQNIAIINLNTPELVECCIRSIRKQGCEWPIVVFDNSQDLTLPAGDELPARTSEAHPFKKRMKGVKVIDNTKGQHVDFDKALQAFPDSHKPHGEVNLWGSDRHMMTVQKLWELLPAGVILVERDILVNADISPLWREEYSFCGYVQKQQRGNRFGRGRRLPML